MPFAHEPIAQKAPEPGWAWTPFEPQAGRPWDLKLAGHLLRRAGLGGTWPELQQALTDGPQRTVQKLLQPAADVAAFNRQQDRLESPGSDSDSAEGQRAWWLRRMLQTPQPLLEKMTLFWQNYFGISVARVKLPALMAPFVRRLRRHALGKFDELLLGLAQEPALLLGLEAAANRKAAPSAHYAQTMLECYSVGPGNFAPRDVRELSRALSGWFVLRGELRYISREHDEDEKQLLGRRGKFTTEEAIRVLVEHPATARFVVRKLYRWLISETDEPSDELLAPLAEMFAKDHDVASLVGTILRSNLFFSETAYRRRVKCPVELAVGLVRTFEGMVETVRLGTDLAGLGQDLYQPPTVYGWPSGTAWVNPGLLVARQNLTAALLAEAGVYGGKLDAAALATKYGQKPPGAQAKFLLDLLFQGDLSDNVREALLREVPAAASTDAKRWLGQFSQRLVALPEFHLA